MDPLTPQPTEQNTFDAMGGPAWCWTLDAALRNARLDRKPFFNWNGRILVTVPSWSTALVDTGVKPEDIGLKS